MCGVADQIHWWEGGGGAVLGALVGALIGSCIPLAWGRWTRRVERKGELTAMVAELYHARIAMDALRKTQPAVEAPLYLLPLTMFERALPKLIGEGRLTDSEVAALVEYVMRAEELNRGLERAGDAAALGALARVSEEYNRNVLKTSHILDDKLERRGGITLFDAAKDAVFRLLDGDDPQTVRAADDRS